MEQQIIEVASHVHTAACSHGHFDLVNLFWDIIHYAEHILICVLCCEFIHKFIHKKAHDHKCDHNFHS